MPRPSLEVADIFRDHGPVWRQANRGHISHDQYKVMNAIERCRTAALGGHVARCTNATCGHTLTAEIDYRESGFSWKLDALVVNTLETDTEKGSASDANR